jgi:hypothetical protein
MEQKKRLNKVTGPFMQGRYKRKKAQETRKWLGAKRSSYSSEAYCCEQATPPRSSSDEES